MGCICAGESDIEHFLTDFIDELKIRKYNEKHFFTYMEKNSPFRTVRTNYDEFLRANQNEEIHTNYQNILITKNHHLFYASLIFLIQSDPKKMAANYQLVLEKIKSSHAEYKKDVLEDFVKDDYDILYDVLIFYTRMVSLEIIEAVQKSKEKRITDEQMKVLKNNYCQIVIEIFVKDLMKDCKNPNVDLEEFFLKNFANLRHVTVREKLRRIFENKDKYLKNVKNDAELVSRQKPEKSDKPEQILNEKSGKYEYVLPNIEYKGNKDVTRENYGSNNYTNNQEDEEECVEGGAPAEDYDMDFKIRAEKERLRLEQYAHYRRECLYHHNRIRAAHGVPALRESDSLSEYSQQWATFLSETDTLTHSSMIWEGKNVGENIAKANAMINDPSQLIVNKWYEEKNNFNFNNPTSQNNTKNFTQMVWKNTESIGFGLAYSQTGNTFMVINYYPAGNIADGYEENVTMSRD